VSSRFEVAGTFSGGWVHVLCLFVSEIIFNVALLERSVLTKESRLVVRALRSTARIRSKVNSHCFSLCLLMLLHFSGYSVRARRSVQALRAR
jgi:hypothetical protein